MQFDLTNIVDVTDAKIRFKKLIELGKTIELKALSDNRSSKQNRALHKLFTIMSEQLNEMGLEFNYDGVTGKKLSTRYTPDVVKNYFWRPIQMALFDIESTKHINTIQINEIVDVISKFFGERGVIIEFPSVDVLMNKR
jgi:hypothetical protein